MLATPACWLNWGPLRHGRQSALMRVGRPDVDWAFWCVRQLAWVSTGSAWCPAANKRPCHACLCIPQGWRPRCSCTRSTCTSPLPCSSCTGAHARSLLAPQWRQAAEPREWARHLQPPHPNPKCLPCPDLTLCSEEQRELARQTLAGLQSRVQQLLGGAPLRVRLQGLEYMNDDPSQAMLACLLLPLILLLPLLPSPSIEAGRRWEHHAGDRWLSNLAPNSSCRPVPSCTDARDVPGSQRCARQPRQPAARAAAVRSRCG